MTLAGVNLAGDQNATSDTSTASCKIDKSLVNKLSSCIPAHPVCVLLFVHHQKKIRFDAEYAFVADIVLRFAGQEAGKLVEGVRVQQAEALFGCPRSLAGPT